MAGTEADDTSPALRATVAMLRQREEASTEALLRRPDMLAEADFAKLCGLSPQELTEWRLEGRVLGFEGSAHRVRYPAWQIGPDGRIFPVVAQVLAAFGRPTSFAAYRFLVTPLDLLGGKAPWELLGGDEEAEVASLAEGAVRGDFF
ncbi:hypothetical protein ACFQX4_17955 [Roseomonas sp. GCM10028921]